jgi:hypothetical protein
MSYDWLLSTRGAMVGNPSSVVGFGSYQESKRGDACGRHDILEFRGHVGPIFNQNSDQQV